jgi:hypothetical protein
MNLKNHYRHLHLVLMIHLNNVESKNVENKKYRKQMIQTSKGRDVKNSIIWKYKSLSPSLLHPHLHPPSGFRHYYFSTKFRFTDHLFSLTREPLEVIQGC